MKNLKTYIKLGLFSYFFFFANTTVADILISHDGDSIFYDEANNYYVIRYVGIDAKINEVIWTPSSNITAEVEVKYKSEKDGGIKYEYEIEVNDDSKQSLVAFRFYTALTGNFKTKKPKNWKEIIRDSYNDQESGKWINWYTSSSPVEAGNDIEGFEVTGMALPAYSATYVEGDTEILTFPDYGPNIEIQTYFQEKIVSKHFNGQAVNSAIPLIPISEPFNSIATYTSFHKYLLEYIEKKYIDESIAQKMSEASVDILNALNNNSTDIALSKLKTLKKLIEGHDDDKEKESDSDNDKKKSYPLINKDLRKILKFNIKFMKKKLKGDSNDNYRN